MAESITIPRRIEPRQPRPLEGSADGHDSRELPRSTRQARLRARLARFEGVARTHSKSFQKSGP